MTHEILTDIKDNWNNVEGLFSMLLKIAERQLELAETMASEEAAYNSAFLGEAESSFKSTDARIRARAKGIVGTGKLLHEYEFEILQELVGITTFRISQLNLRLPVVS